MKKIQILITVVVLAAAVSTSLLAHGRTGRGKADCESSYIIAQQGRTIVRGCVDYHDFGRTKKKYDGDFVWFTKDKTSYLIRDAVWISRASDAFTENAPMKAARKQLRAQEKQIAKHEREIERSVRRIEKQIDRIEDGRAEGDRAALKQEERALEARAKEMEREARRLEAAAETLEREYEAMEEVADRKLEKIFADAIRAGVAKKVE